MESLEIRGSRVFDLTFANYTIFSYFLIFLLSIDLHCLIPAVIIYIVNPIAEFTLPIGVPTNEAKKDFESQPVIVETKANKCSM